MEAALTSLILWAEDDENDAILFKRAFQKAHLSKTVVRVHDGEEAIKYLNGDGCYADRSQYPLPSLLLLDIKMPHKDGFEVLEWKQSRPDLRDLPVVMFSSSDIERDVETAERLGARAFLVKPGTLDGMRGVVSTLSALQG
jgi:CheY-like chemotaxis protein